MHLLHTPRTLDLVAQVCSFVAQVCNLPYRRFLTCAARTPTKTPTQSFIFHHIPYAILLPLLLLTILTLTAATPSSDALPYVYTQWEQITTRDGLANDHVFAVRADPRGDCIWIGTEGGLSRYDKQTKQIRNWTEADGLPWRVITGIEVQLATGDVWLGLFGGGLARFSAGRFDHYHQLNSGLVNDVVYAVAIEGDNVWCATTAGASRFNTKTDKWDIYTEQNAPMEEIWNYNVCARDGKVHLAVWGSGILEFDTSREHWKIYTDPDGEMEIDLYRDDGVPHVITTGASYVDKILWVSSYFGCARYDGRHWRGYFDHECGLASNFNNNLKARSGQECWYCTDKGLSACMDAETCTWVTYVPDGKNHAGQAIIKRENEVLQVVDTGYNVPQIFQICVDFDGNDVWAGTSKGLGHGIGKGYYSGLRPAGSNRAQP